MKLNQKLSPKPISIILIALVLFTPGFYRNQWHAAGKKWFYDWRHIQEGIVIARIIEPRNTGAFSHGGLLGFGCDVTENCDWESIDLDYEYNTYKENGQFQSYAPYTSHPGLQGFFLASLKAQQIFLQV